MSWLSLFEYHNKVTGMPPPNRHFANGKLIYLSHQVISFFLCSSSSSQPSWHIQNSKWSHLNFTLESPQWNSHISTNIHFFLKMIIWKWLLFVILTSESKFFPPRLYSFWYTIVRQQLHIFFWELSYQIPQGSNLDWETFVVTHFPHGHSVVPNAWCCLPLIYLEQG